MAKRVPDFLSTLRIVAIALLAGAVLAGACTRRQTMASKSAAAYDEAVERGLPIGSAHGDHGHGAVGSHSGEEPPEGDTNPISGMDHQDHSASAGGDHQSMAGMEPSKRARRGSGSAPPMDHSRTAGFAREASAGGDHSKTPGDAAPPDSDRPLEPPDWGAEIIELDPAVTLRRDALDAPAPGSVSEARKAGGAAHSDHGGAEEAAAEPAPPAPPGHDQHSAPPAPEGKR